VINFVNIICDYLNCRGVGKKEQERGKGGRGRKNSVIN
jgi:hypothetical protein